MRQKSLQASDTAVVICYLDGIGLDNRQKIAANTGYQWEFGDCDDVGRFSGQIRTVKEILSQEELACEHQRIVEFIRKLLDSQVGSWRAETCAYRRGEIVPAFAATSHS